MYYTQPSGVVQQSPNMFYNSLLACTTPKLQFPNIYYNCMYYTQPPGVVQQYPKIFYNNLQSPSMYYTCINYTQPPGVVQQAPGMYYKTSSFLVYITPACTTHSLQSPNKFCNGHSPADTLSQHVLQVFRHSLQQKGEKTV